MKTEQQNTGKITPEATIEADGPNKMTRREALAMVGKHAVYTAPAVLAVLAATKSNSAHASPNDPPCQPFPGCLSK